MRPQQPFLDLWRLVLEAQSPLSIASGRSDLVDDVVLTTTPAGLPYIPATALAGVLRHALHAQEGLGAANALFGAMACRDSGQEAGQASRLECSHAHIHDARNRVVSDLLAEVPTDDPILGPLVNELPVKRQRVRINAHGAAADTGHFDRSVVPAGHRFSVELRVWSPSAEAAEQAHKQLQALLFSPALRVGGLTRSGLGQLGVQQCAHRRIDLRNAKELAFYVERPQRLDDTKGLQLQPLPASGASDTPWATLQFDLQAEGALRVGQGYTAYSEPGQDKLPHALLYTEVAVHWPAGKELAKLQPRIVIPGTAIKGAIAHRLAFHDQRLRGAWASAERVKDSLQDHPHATPGVTQWLGCIKSSGTQTRSQAGGLIFEDIVIAAPPAARQIGHRTHNSIDRFTGGVREGLLFTEEYLFGVKLPLRLHLTLAACRRADAHAWEALRLTLDDLAHGRLAIGADSASGLGYLQGRYPTDDFEALRAAAVHGTHPNEEVNAA
jgi:CRISPR/Cas system CSM-associated protein Csm3 (group 7 of RAMP superfamily)